MSPDELFEALSDFLRERQRSFSQLKAKLRDLPSKLFDNVLMSGDTLRKVGRTTAKEYVECDAVVSAALGEGPDGMVLYGKRRSLFFKSEDDGYVRKTDSLGGLDKETLMTLYALYTCRTAAEAAAHLQCLGVKPPFDLLQLVRFVNKWAVVKVQTKAVNDDDMVSQSHGLVQCLACRPYMTSGGCEHCYAALAKEKRLDLRVPRAKQAAKKRAVGKRQTMEVAASGKKPKKRQARLVPECAEDSEQEAAEMDLEVEAEEPGEDSEQEAAVMEVEVGAEKPCDEGAVSSSSIWRPDPGMSPAERGVALRRIYGDGKEKSH